MKKRLRTALAAMTGVLVFSVPGLALAEGAFRTVLVIDASSSMRKTDPHELRKVAAELYVDMARVGDRIAITAFDGAARESTGGFIEVGGIEDRNRLKEAIRSVGNDGGWTDFTAGLLEAKRLLATEPSGPEDQQLVIFLTDGRCDPDPKGPFADKGKNRKEREAACQEEVLGEIAGALGGARVYAMGLSKAAPRDFLEELGRRTGGAGVVAERADELPRHFAGVYARLLGSRLTEGEVTGETVFPIWAGAATVDVVVVGKMSKSPRLFDASGAEVPIHNKEPERHYFVGATEYRFYKVAAPEPGPWKLEVLDAGTYRWAVLQHFALALTAVGVPEAAEMGDAVGLRARLASPEGVVPPDEFLARHRVHAVVEDGDDEAKVTLALKDGVWTGEHVAKEVGTLRFRLFLEPAADGVLTRHSEAAELEVIPPLKLMATAVEIEDFKEGTSGSGTLSLAGTEVGVAVELKVWLDAQDGSVSPGSFAVKPDGERKLTLELTPDATLNGEYSRTLVLTPVKPTGFEDRKVEVELTANIVPLTFWERYGLYVEIAAGLLLLLVLILGFMLPKRFPKRAMLYYMDIRDPELPRRSSYPLGAKAKAGFYRGASIQIGPSGPVKRAGKVELWPSGGKAIIAKPAGGAKIFRVPTPDEEEDGDRYSVDEEDKQRVSLNKAGVFRVTAGVRYEVDGGGLVFWYK